MIEILQFLQQYVPNSRTEDQLHNSCYRDDTASRMPEGGDQLTCERIRGAHMARLDGYTAEERLEGLFTIVEDFHEKMIFLQLIMSKYFKANSCREAGTLFQIKNLIDRRNVVCDVSKDYHAVSDFIDLLTECHVLAAALTHLNMDSLQSDCKRLPHGIHLADNNIKRRLLLQIVGEIVDQHFLNALTASVDRIEDTEVNDTSPSSTCNDSKTDGVYNYATNLTKLGLLRKVSIKANRYGDGMRMLRHWKYAMPLYHQAHKIKYRLESFLLLAGVNALFTPRHRHQVIHNRCVNLSGGEGHNLYTDYVMELLNNYAKSRLHLLGPNHSPEIVNRIGRTRLICHNIQMQLEKRLHVAPVSRKGTVPSLERDRGVVLQQLMDSSVFTFIPGRLHQSFATENMDILSDINIREFHKWISEKKRDYSNRKLAF